MAGLPTPPMKAEPHYTLARVKRWHDWKVTVTVDKGVFGPERYAIHTGSKDYIRRVLRDRYGLTLPTL